MAAVKGSLFYFVYLVLIITRINKTLWEYLFQSVSLPASSALLLQLLDWCNYLTAISILKEKAASSSSQV